jgi:hypothetical protein
LGGELPATLMRTRPFTSSDGDGLRLEPARRRRRPLLAVGSLALVATCIALFTGAYTSAGAQMSVIAVVNRVAQGQTITGADLKVVKITRSTGLAIVPAANADAYLGRPASVSLLPGTLLAPGDVSSDVAPPLGDAIVGIAIKPGQMPAAGVAPGEHVDIVLTGQPGSADTASPPSTSSSQSASGPLSGPGTVLLPSVLVTDVRAQPASGGSGETDVSLLVPREFAPDVANASAANEAALVVVRFAN